MKKNYRGQRLSEEIKKIVSEMLLRDLKDPAFSEGMISISHVKSADDGSFATVYFTALGADAGTVISGFEKAKGRIRGEIGRKLALRHTPDLRFKVDETEDYGRHIDSIIDGLEIKHEVPEKLGEEVSIAALAEVIEDFDNIFFLVHENMDGDALGSASALALSLRDLGKKAYVVSDETPPRILEFLRIDVLISLENAIKSAEDCDEYLTIAVDFAEKTRSKEGAYFFENAATTMCIDHHVTSKPIYDYNHIDPKAGAAAEIVYDLIKTADWPINEEIATALYAGILTDTGRFQYANTTSKTHIIAAELIDCGVEITKVFNKIYQSITPEKLMLEKAVIETMELFADGKAAIACLTQEMLKNTNAKEEDADGMSEKMRSIDGVEVSAFVKEREDGSVKVSMRSKEYFDVADYTNRLGGGGHVRAAGFNSNNSIKDTVEKLKTELTAELYISK